MWLGPTAPVVPNHAIADLTDREQARITKCLVSPRPIAWVSTRDADGNDNLAPYSSSNYVTSAPPVVVFNASHRDDGDLKHSARNAIDTGEFAVNLVTEDVLEAMDHTSASVPRGESEFDLAGLDRAPCETIDAPRVAEAAATMECTLHDSVEVYNKVMVLGEVQHVHLDERLLTDGEIDMHNVDAVGRLGGPYYTDVDLMELERRF
jgi:flavin reductase (DIM6/NTAB) family NADH-FMN oxidoreductase RutF